MRGRNVMLVILESTGARHLGLYGGTPDPAPNLTELARRSILFERAYAVYPESIKGLFATLCSRYPAFDTPPELYAEVPCASLPATLASAGYRTALFHSGRFAYLGMRSVIDHRGFAVLEDAGAIGGRVDSSFGVDEASAVERMLGWIDSLPKGERFFVTYMPIAGHHPYASSTDGPFTGDDDFARYMNAVHEGDAALGQLLRGLRERQLDDDTLVVVFGDHGEAFGEHQGNFAHTLFIHEENVRVPYVIAAPGAITEAIRVKRVASVIDTAPTIVDLARVARGRRASGRVPAPSRIADGALLHRLLAWLAWPDGRLLEVSLRDRFAEVATVRRLRGSRRDPRSREGRSAARRGVPRARPGVGGGAEGGGDGPALEHRWSEAQPRQECLSSLSG